MIGIGSDKTNTPATAHMLPNSFPRPDLDMMLESDVLLITYIKDRTYTGAISPYPTVVIVTTTQYIPVGMEVKPETCVAV